MEVTSPYKAYQIPHADLYSTFLGVFQTHADKPAVVDTCTGQIVTFSEVETLVEIVARRLLHDGFRKGDRLAFCCINCIDYAIFMAACFRLGGTFVGINHILTKDDILKQLELAGAKFIFTGYHIAAKVLESVKSTNVKVYVEEYSVEGNSATSVETLYSKSPDHYPELPALSDLDIDPDHDPCGILFSSGTTGFPKPVMLSHTNIVANSYNLKHPEINQLALRHQVIYQPFCHIFGMNLMCLTFMFGVTTLIMRKFNLEEYLSLVAQNKVETIHVVPPVAVKIGKSVAVSKYDLSHIELICTGAGPIGSKTETEVLNRIKSKSARFRQVYGLTETTGILTLTPRAGHLRDAVPPGSVGFLAPETTAKVVDIQTGRTLGPNQEGEILVKGPQIMLGYKNNPEATRATIDQEGWLHTGDIGTYNKDGYFFVTDRLKELIKYKGYQVAPVELENHILSHPLVVDVGVFSVQDEEAGELPRAWVVKKPDAELSEAQLLRFVHDHVAAYKKLRGGVRFVDIIPRSASGKVLRRIMKREDQLQASDKASSKKLNSKL